MALINIAGKSYELVLENKSGWNAEAFRNRYSEVLERYDYIVGDWGYEQLRLKGFFKDGSSKATKESGFSFVVDYINEYCNFGCAYFVLEKKSDHVEQSAVDDEIDPLLDDLDQLYEEDVQQAIVHTSQFENDNDDLQKPIPQQKGQEKASKRRPFKQRTSKSANSSNHFNNQQATVTEDAVRDSKDPTKKNKRRSNRPYRHFDRKKNKEQVSTTQE